jgi:tetratricopeptide (TPR) repeat protein
MTFAFFIFCFFVQSLTPEVIEHAQAGAAAQKQGQYDVAIKEFRRVTELQPNSASGHANLGDAYFQNGEYGSAIPELEEALRLNPKLMGSHQMLGVAMLLQGDAAGALPHLEQTHTPELLGLAYLETGRLGSAIMALQVSLQRQPNDPDLLYYFGQAAAQAGRRTANQLAKMDPNLASAKEREQRPLRDVATLQTALAKQPNDPDLLFDFQRAAALASKLAFDKILESSAGSARAHQVAAERYMGLGRLPDAEIEYSESLRLKPYAPGVHLALGNVLAAQGKARAAIVQFRLEVNLRPADVNARYRLAAALLAEGQANEAVAEFGSADRLRPNTPEILLALGKAAAAARDDGRAEQSWRKLLTIDHASDFASEAHLCLAGMYREAGKKPEADSEMAAYQRLKDQGKN